MVEMKVEVKCHLESYKMAWPLNILSSGNYELLE